MINTNKQKKKSIKGYFGFNGMVPCYEYMDGLPYVIMSVYLIVIFFGSFFYVNRKMFAREINYMISSYKAIKITGFSTTTTTTTTAAATSGIFSKYFTGKNKKDTEGEEVVLTVDTSVGQILRTENEESKEEGIEFKEETKPEEEKEIEKENEVLIAAADIILDVRANEEEEEKQK